jgi:hypothetical protein
MIKCSECGYENMDGLDYCDGCGAKLQAAASSEADAAAGTGGVKDHPAQEPTHGAAVSAADTEVGAHASAGPGGGAGEDSGPGEMKPAEHASDLPPAEAAAALAPEPSRAPTGEMKAPESPAAPETAPAGAPPFKAKLSIIRGGRRGQEFELETGNNLVGRWDPETGSFPEVDLDADDPEAKVSRKHALIRIDAGKITIEDIGSLNGTYVNRQPRLQPGNPLDLKTGDEIIIGKTFLKLVIDPIS